MISTLIMEFIVDRLDYGIKFVRFYIKLFFSIYRMYKATIYIITNTVDNMIYIGSTKTSLEERMYKHKNAAKSRTYNLY